MAPVSPPTVTNTNWVSNPVDAFILSKLEAKGIEPAPSAKRRTLVRRLNFDLLGVPVTTVKLRGEYDNHGKVVKAGFPSIVTGHTKPAAIRLDPFKRWPTRSRRMALAKWIASKDNPLTTRVMMNRLWYRHFGRGIVKTPSDFGKLSGGASHPELLDWLAGQFVDHCWSLKAMYRLIVT